MQGMQKTTIGVIEMDDNFGKNLGALLSERGMSMRQLAEKTNISFSTIARIVAGDSTGTHKSRIDIAQALGVSLAALTKRQVSEPVPLLPWDRLSGGQHKDYAEMWIPCPVDHGDYAFAARVSGMSMVPGTPHEKGFLPGDIVFVDPDVKPRAMDFVLVAQSIGEAPILRRLQEGDGIRLLEATNSQWPEKLVKMSADAKILGTVVANVTKLR